MDQIHNNSNQPSDLHQGSARSFGEQYDVPAYQETPPPTVPTYPTPPYEEHPQPPPNIPPYPAPPYEEYSQPPPYYGSVQVSGQPQVAPPAMQVPPQIITAIPATRQGRTVRVPVRNQYQEVRGVDLGSREAIPPTTTFDRFCDTCSCHVYCCITKVDFSLASRLLLRKARREGWWMFWSLILPLVFSVKLVVMWMIIQLVLSISLVALSAFVYADRDTNDGHDVNQSGFIHLIASCAFLLLSDIDALLLCCIAPARITDAYRWSITTILVRLAYTAVCLYITTICGAVLLAIKFPDLHERHGSIIFAQAFLTFVYFFGLVHLATLVVIGAVFRITNILVGEDPSKSIGFSGVLFGTRFAIHFLGQVFVQVLLLLTIGVRLHYDNTLSNGDLVQIDAYLWTMIVIGFVIPIAGTLLFFVTHVYWVQEFLIGVFTIIISIANGPDSEFGDPLDWLSPNDSQLQRLHELKRNTNLETLKQEAMLMRKRDSSYKILLPFEAPIPAFLCVLYAILFLVFCGFALLHHSGGENDTPFAPTHGWNIFYYVALGFYAALNVYGLVIGLFWLVIVVVTMVIILLLLVFLRRWSRDLLDGINLTACCHDTIG